MSLQLSDFESLVDAIADVHQQLRQQAAKAVNTALTLRNWFVRTLSGQLATLVPAIKSRL